MTSAFLLAVAYLSIGNAAEAMRLGQFAAEHSTPVQRRANAIRLRGLAARHPGMPGVQELIALFEDESPP
jgi:hypothetical protein